MKDFDWQQQRVYDTLHRALRNVVAFCDAYEKGTVRVGDYVDGNVPNEHSVALYLAQIRDVADSGLRNARYFKDGKITIGDDENEKAYSIFGIQIRRFFRREKAAGSRSE